MSARVLVADDDDAYFDLVTQRLQAAGFDILGARDGRQALETARQAKPDVLVLDLMMPRMNGYEVLQALRSDAATAALPVIIMSAKNFPVDKKTAQGLGVVLYLVKPFDFDGLISGIRKLSENNSPTQPQPPQP